MADSERQARVVALLEDSVRAEITVTNGMLDLGLSAATIERLMEGVTSGILHAFDVEWAPGWVKPGEVHTWNEAGDWFGRCSICLLDSPPKPSEPGASAWALRHVKGH
jgi:hypothetical protein